MIRTRLKDALKAAQKEKDKCSVSTLRLITAALKDRDIAARCKGTMDGIDEDEVLGLLQSMVNQRRESIELYEKTVLVVGMGRIGSLVAPRCQAFGMDVRVCDPYIPQSDISDAGFTPAADFAAALPQADIVTLHTPLNDETRHMIDAPALARMKNGALLVNTSRGPVVDGDALSAAVASGHIYAAGVDVLEEEPPALDSPLLGHANMVFTPHVGGLTRECFYRSAIVCAQISLDAIDGKLDPAYVVNPEVL